MALNQQEQAIKKIKESQAILVAFKKDYSGDALASALALAKVLRALNKQVDIACSEFKLNQRLSFLAEPDIKPQLTGQQKFVIKVDTKNTKVAELFYDHREDELNIYLTAKVGQFKPEDVSSRAGDYKYDLIILINTSDLLALDSIYEDNRAMFNQLVKINIDHSGRNENFGEINLVDIGKNATAEIVCELIKNLGENLIDEEVATDLLLGIVCATKNFRVANLKPETLTLASWLVAQGAKQKEIIKNLYQSRPFSALKLWGRILLRLNQDFDGQLVWSAASANDFLETAATPGEMTDIIEELIVSLPRAEVAVLFYEAKDNNSNEVKAIIYSFKKFDALVLAKVFSPQGNAELAKIILENISLVEAERLVIEEIKKVMRLITE